MIAFALVGTTTACGFFQVGGDKPPPQPGKDWFGNPLPSSDPTCIEQEQKAPKTPTQGISRTHIVLTVRALDNTGKDICVPILLHVYGTVAGHTGLKLDENTPLPWDGARVTNWSASIVVEYDRSKMEPPEYMVNLIVTHDPPFGGNDMPDGMVLMCMITVNGQPVDSHQVPMNLRVPARSTTGCKVNAIAN